MTKTLADLKPGDKVILCVPSIRASGPTTRSLRTVARRTKYLIVVNGTSYHSADGKPYFRRTKSWIELGTPEEICALESEQATINRQLEDYANRGRERQASLQGRIVGRLCSITDAEAVAILQKLSPAALAELARACGLETT